MVGLWITDRLGIAFTKGRGPYRLTLRMLTPHSREPVTYDELLLPLEAPGNQDRRGDLSECKTRR